MTDAVTEAMQRLQSAGLISTVVFALESVGSEDPATVAVMVGTDATPDQIALVTSCLDGLPHTIVRQDQGPPRPGVGYRASR